MTQEITTANKEQQPSDQPQDNSYQDLAGRLQEIEGVGEDTAEFIARNWKSLVWLLVAILVAAVIVQQFVAAKGDKLADSATKFVVLQNELDAHQTFNAETMVALEDQIDGLSSSAAGEFYSNIAPLYQALVLIKAEKGPSARKLLQDTYATDEILRSSSPKVAKSITPLELITELAALLELRSLSQMEDASFESLKPLVASAASAAQLINTESIALLASFASSSEERAEIEALLLELESSRPQLREQIEALRGELGYTVKPPSIS